MSTTPSRLRLWVMTHLVTLVALSGCQSLPPVCTAPTEIQPHQLQGTWLVQLNSNGAEWTLQLGPHPEHQGSLRGELTQGAKRYPVVADLEEGEFTLEESHDGQRIAATWLGKVQTYRCKVSITGERQTGQDTRPAQSFVIHSHRLR